MGLAHARRKQLGRGGQGGGHAAAVARQAPRDADTRRRAPAPAWLSPSSSPGASAADSIRQRRDRWVSPGSASDSSARLPATCRTGPAGGGLALKWVVSWWAAHARSMAAGDAGLRGQAGLRTGQLGGRLTLSTCSSREARLGRHARRGSS